MDYRSETGLGSWSRLKTILFLFSFARAVVAAPLSPSPRCLIAPQNDPKASPTESNAPILVRESNGRVRLEWAGLLHRLPAEMIAHGHPLSSSTIEARIIVDGEHTLPTAPGQTSAEIDLMPGWQHDLVLEFFGPDGRVFHRTANCLLEDPTVHTISPESFATLPKFAASLPERLASGRGLDNDLPRLAVQISHEKVAWVLNRNAPADLQHLLQATSPDDFSVKVRFDSKGAPLDITFGESGTGKLYHAKPAAVRIKVDAAFNGNAFFWDDMFVSLQTAFHDPELAKSTLDFWYEVQSQNAAGEIPREVRKQNLTSYNPPELVVFGNRGPNGAYTNPNLTGWAEWQLYALAAPETGRARLLPAIRSIDQYLHWEESERAVRDVNGHAVSGAFWQDNLGSGMDNLPRGGGDDHPELSSRTAWVDLLAQAIGQLKAEGRMHAALGDWARAANSERETARLESVLNTSHWSDSKNFYFDRILGPDGKFHLDTTSTSIAGMWPLWAGAVPPERVEKLVQAQLRPDRFGGAFPFPALPMDHPLYSDDGHYWRGGRWPNVAAMAIQGLENSGRPDLAWRYATRFLHGMGEVSREYAKTHGRGSVFEFYGVQRKPDGTVDAKIGVEPGHVTRVDFAGWGAVPPVYSELRQVVGLRPVAGFAGPLAERDKWLDMLTRSPLFAHTNFWRLNPFAPLPRQRHLAADGYLEWNLFFDPGTEATTVLNINYRGEWIDKMELRKISRGSFVISIQSRTSVPLQVNRLFGLGGPSATPLAASPIVLVGGSVPRKNVVLVPSLR